MTPATLHAARQVLPAWVVWAPLLAPLLAVPVTVALVWIGVLASGGLRGLAPDAHWTERARRLYVARRVRLVCIALAGLATLPLAIGGPVSIGAAFGRALAAALTLATGVALWFRFEDRHVRRVSAAVRLRSLAAMVLCAGTGYLALLVGAVIPGSFAPGPGLLVYAVVVVAGTLGGGVLLARALGLVRPAPERLRAALARLGPGAGPPRLWAGARPPRLWVVQALHANAFALHALRAVVFTEGALAHLDDAQLAAVLAHEVEHLREPRWVRAANAVAAVLLPLGLPLLWALGSGRSFAIRLIIADAGLVAYVVVLRLHRRLRRALEVRSDAAARARSPVYAAALEVMYRANLFPAVLRGKRHTHPDLVDRLAAAGVEPAWPRPAPPASYRAAIAAAAIAAGLALGAGALARRAWSASALAEAPGLRAVAVSGDAASLASLGWSRCLAGAIPEGLPLLRAAREQDPRQPAWPTWEALAFARAGRCREARSAMEAAQDLARDPEGLTSVREAVAGCTPR